MTLLRPTHSQSGMTFVEMIVVVSIYTVLLLAITSSVAYLYQTNSYAIEQADEIENARRGMNQWSRDAKEMTTAEDGTYPVVSMDEHQFSYYSDTDVDNSVEYIEYILTGTTLTKRVYNATGNPLAYDYTTPDSVQILSEYVRNIDQGLPTFQYFDNTGTQLTSASPVINVRYITAQIIVNVDPGRSPGEFMLRSSIAPRNLKDNL